MTQLDDGRIASTCIWCDQYIVYQFVPLGRRPKQTWCAVNGWIWCNDSPTGEHDPRLRRPA